MNNWTIRLNLGGAVGIASVGKFKNRKLARTALRTLRKRNLQGTAKVTKLQ